MERNVQKRIGEAIKSGARRSRRVKKRRRNANANDNPNQNAHTLILIPVVVSNWCFMFWVRCTILPGLVQGIARQLFQA